MEEVIQFSLGIDWLLIDCRERGEGSNPHIQGSYVEEEKRRVNGVIFELLLSEIGYSLIILFRF